MRDRRIHGPVPKDKFTVKTATTADTIWWENTNEMSEAHFDVLHADMLAHMKGRDYFVQDVFCGADPSHRLDRASVHGTGMAQPVHSPHVPSPRSG